MSESPSRFQVNREQLHEIMPFCPLLRLAVLAPPLNAALDEFAINTPLRASAFIAQLALESAQFRHFEELASGVQYEGRKDLGNVHPGDGKRFKGRGPIQLTGRSNYRDAGEALGIPLEDEPRRASDADVGFRIAGWFWTKHGLNELADKGTEDAFDEITHRINGGYKGKPLRDSYYRTARRVFGVVS